MFVTIDAGNYTTKYFYRDSEGKLIMNNFLSVSHPYIPIASYDHAEEHENMLHIKYLNFDSLIGEGVKSLYATKPDTPMFTGNVRKGHIDGVLRIIASLYQINRETEETNFDLVVTSPLVSIQKDKNYFLERLSGNRSALVNGDKFSFTINKLNFAPEGLGAKQFVDKANYVIVDAGSQTTNILKVYNNKILDNSVTLNGGTQTEGFDEIAMKIFKFLSNVELGYPIRVTGGKCNDLVRSLEDIGYTNCEAVVVDDVDPFYINGLGVYMILENIINGGEEQ